MQPGSSIYIYFPFRYVFRGPLPKRHFCTQKGSPATEVCAALHFQSSGQPLDRSRWCCLTPLPCFLGCGRGTRCKSSFNKVLSRQSSQVQANLFASELQQTYVLHIVIENTGMEEIVLQRGPVPMTLHSFKQSFTVLFFFLFVFGLMLQSRKGSGKDLWFCESRKLRVFSQGAKEPFQLTNRAITQVNMLAPRPFWHWK